MKRSHTIGVAALVLLAALAGYWSLSLPPHTNPADAGGAPDREVRTRRPPRPALPDDTTHVTFPGLEPLKFSTRKSSSMADISAPYEPLDDTLVTVCDIYSLRKTPIELTTDEQGRILKLVANKGLHPTVADRKEIPELFKQQDIEIVRLGNDAAKVGDRTFMLGLLYTLDRYATLNIAEFDEEVRDNVQVPNTELEIIPVTYIDRCKPYDGEASTEERPGLLWMAKHRGLPSGYISQGMSALPPDAACWVEWNVIPINLSPQEMGKAGVLNHDNWNGTPKETFELRIKSPTESTELQPDGAGGSH